MAEYGSMNATTTSGSETSDWDTGYTIAIVFGLVSTVGVLVTIIGCCLKHCRKRRGNVHVRIPSEDQEQIDIGDTGTVLQDVQRGLQNKYRTLSIPKIAARDDKASKVADVDELYTDLQLLQATEHFINEDLTTRDGEIRVGKSDKKILESWTDLLNPETVKNLMIILSGGAGFGKTTLFRTIAHTWATSNQLAQFKLLFLIELKKMKTSSIIDAILDQCFLRDERPDRNRLISLIKHNKQEMVFLLDGLDELQPRFLEPSEDEYCLYNVLHKEALQQSRVLVATRPHKVADIIEGYPRSLYVETSGFTEKSTERYIRSYFGDDEGKGRELIEIMKTKKSLRQLAHIPVICQIVCYTFKFGGSQLPDRSAQLYRKFTEVLAQRRCVGEDWKQRLETALAVLGRVALDGLLDDRELVLTQREFEDCASVLNETFQESGFIQQETYESVDGPMVIVTFLHKTFQEYCAAYYLVNLYYVNNCLRRMFSRKTFRKKLKQINPGNVHAMEYLLRFACGISSASPATGLILEHVQKQHNEEICRDEVELSKLVRQLLLESGSNEMADKLDRPTDAECDSQEELLAMRHYLQCLRQPLVELEEFTFYCTSHDELVLLRDINDLLRDNTAIRPEFHITCRSHEDLKLLSEMLLNGNIRPVAAKYVMTWRKPFWVTYIMSEQANEDMQTLEETLEGMDERLRDQTRLALEINEMSHFGNDCVLGSLFRVRNQIDEVKLRNRTYDDVIRLMNALSVCGCNGLRWVDVSDTNLHGHLRDVVPLVPRSLWSLKLRSCGLNDDDVPDLISILPAGHRLSRLTVDGNAFSADGVETLTAHLKNLPLYSLVLDYNGPDAEHVKQVVKQNLSNVILT